MKLTLTTKLDKNITDKEIINKITNNTGIKILNKCYI